MIVLALDPGFDRLGWSVGQVLPPAGKINLLSFGLIETDKKQDLFARYLSLHQQVAALIKEFQPHEAALETLFLFKNQKTVMRVAEVRGILLITLLTQGVKVSQYSPPQIKAAVAGFGRADKKGLEKMIRLQLAIPPTVKVVDDTFDALGVLLTHATLRQAPQTKLV